MTKNRSCTSDIGQSYTGVEPSKLVESDQLQDWEEEFDERFGLAQFKIKNVSLLLEEDDIKQFISNLIKKEREAERRKVIDAIILESLQQEKSEVIPITKKDANKYCGRIGYNQCLKDVIDIVKSKL